MKKLLFSLLFLTHLTCFSQTVSAVFEIAEFEERKLSPSLSPSADKTLLPSQKETARYPFWIARKDGAEIIIIGENHSLSIEFESLPLFLKSKIENSNAIGIEAAFDTMPSGVFSVHSEKKISTIVGDDAFERLLGAIKANATKHPMLRQFSFAERLDGTHPWIAGLQIFSAISAQPTSQRYLHSSVKGVPLSSALVKMYGKSKPIYSLDDLDSIKNIWAACNDAETTARYLMSAVSDGLSMRRTNGDAFPRFSIDVFYNGWEKLDVLYKKRLQIEFGSIHDHCVVVPRNRRWIGKMLDQASGFGSIVYVVGIFHLLGRDNLVDLLRDNGFSLVLYE
jgi:uncharacterized protein YbaP (TraB family)